MDRDVIDKIEDLVTQSLSNKQYKINGKIYTNQELIRIEPDKCETVRLNSVQALVDFINTTILHSKSLFKLPLLVKAGYEKMTLSSSLDDNMDRNALAIVYPIVPTINFNQWMSLEEFVIQLQTCFVDTDNKTNLIQLVSGITSGTTVETTDDGMGQKVVVQQGTSLKTQTKLQPIVNLKPYRTYQEIEQVESMYLIRVRDGGELKIIEADGGAWKLEAQRRISTYLNCHLSKQIKNDEVVIIG